MRRVIVYWYLISLCDESGVGTNIIIEFQLSYDSSCCCAAQVIQYSCSGVIGHQQPIYALYSSSCYTFDLINTTLVHEETKTMNTGITQHKRFNEINFVTTNFEGISKEFYWIGKKDEFTFMYNSGIRMQRISLTMKKEFPKNNQINVEGLLYNQLHVE